MPRPAVLLATALLLAGSAGCALRRDVVTDAELRRDGAWTAADARARGLLGPGRPVRLVPLHRKFLDEVELPGGGRLPIPRLFSGGGLIDLSALLGFHFEPRYYHLPDARATVLLSRQGPAVILGDDPDVDPLAPDAPPEVFDRLAAELARDMEALFGPPPAEPGPEEPVAP